MLLTVQDSFNTALSFFVNVSLLELKSLARSVIELNSGGLVPMDKRLKLSLLGGGCDKGLTSLLANQKQKPA